MSELDPLIVNYYYAVFVTTSVSFNGLLIYLINYKSPHTHSSFKLLLMNTAINQILLALMAGFVQQRLLLSSSATVLLPVGPCRPFGVMTCFVGYNIIIALNLNVQMSTILSMFFRYRLIQTNAMTTTQLRTSFIISLILPIAFIITSHIGPFGFDMVMEIAARDHPEHNLAEYGEFGGYESTNDLISTFNAFISFAIALATPVLILYWKNIILKKLRLNEHKYSEITKRGSKIFLKALTSQAVIQLLCYLPVSAIYFGAKYSNGDIVVTEYALVVIMTAPCVIDPIFSFYFIPPYRKWIWNQFRSHVLRTQRSSINPLTNSTTHIFVASSKL